MKKLSEMFFPDFKGREIPQSMIDDHAEMHHSTLNLHVQPVTSPEIRRSLSEYTDDSKSINQHLINKDYRKIHNTQSRSYPYEKLLDDHIDNIKQHIKSSTPLRSEISTFSGIGANMAQGIKIGATLHTPAFTSSSLNYDTAHNFSRPSKWTDYELPRTSHVKMTTKRNNVLHFKLPAGYDKGAYVDKHSANSGEKEFLLHPDQKWKVTGHKAVGKIGTSYKNFTHIWTVEPHSDDEGN
jgi:hypothetical protein